jgi:hypothetical protein
MLGQQGSRRDTITHALPRARHRAKAVERHGTLP